MARREDDVHLARTTGRHGDTELARATDDGEVRVGAGDRGRHELTRSVVEDADVVGRRRQPRRPPCRRRPRPSTPAADAMRAPTWGLAGSATVAPNALGAEVSNTTTLPSADDRGAPWASGAGVVPSPSTDTIVRVPASTAAATTSPPVASAVGRALLVEQVRGARREHAPSEPSKMIAGVRAAGVGGHRCGARGRRLAADEIDRSVGAVQPVDLRRAGVGRGCRARRLLDGLLTVRRSSAGPSRQPSANRAAPAVRSSAAPVPVVGPVAAAGRGLSGGVGGRTGGRGRCRRGRWSRCSGDSRRGARRQHGAGDEVGGRALERDVAPVVGDAPGDRRRRWRPSPAGDDTDCRRGAAARWRSHT